MNRERSIRTARLRALAVGASLLAFGNPSYAQTETTESIEGVEAITVTARKREERLQEAPISITALSSATLERAQVGTIAGISNFTPNLILNESAAISGNNAASTTFIRGIGQYDFTPTTEPAVGLYVDGVYVARSVGALLDVADVERVEVLRGPQGTLFGRNTIGGAVSITSLRPSDDAFEGYVDVRTGSFERFDAKAAVNIPIAEGLAVRASGSRRSRQGYVRRVSDGVRNGNQDSWSGRIDLLAETDSGFSARLIVDGTRRRENMAANQLVAVYPNSGFVQAHNTQNAGAACTPNPGPVGNSLCYNSQWIPQKGERITYGTFPSQSDLDLWGISLNLEQEVGEITIRSISAYRDMKSISSRDGDHSPLRIFETIDDYDQWQFSQEFQVLGTSFDDRLKWIAGAYYFKEKGGDANMVYTSRIDFMSGGRIDNDSAAVFGQATFDVTDKLSVTGGLRYTKDWKRFLPDQYVTNSGLTPFPVGSRLAPYVNYRSTYQDLNPTADVSYKFSRDVMTYFRFSEGFKSGGYAFRFFPPTTTVPDYQPEYAKVYELGFKSTVLDRRLQFNAAVFRTDYTNIQVSGIPTGRVGAITFNAGDARIYGGEVEISARPIPPLRLQFGAGYLDPGYRNVPTNLGAIDVNNASRFAYAPTWSLTGNASYEIETGIGTITPQFDWSYRTKVYGNPANTPAAIQPAYHLVNGSVAWRDPSNVWQVTAGATNLFDKRYFTTAYASPSVGYSEVLFGRPREWFLGVRRSF